MHGRHSWRILVFVKKYLSSMLCGVQKSEIAITLMLKSGIADKNTFILFHFISIPPIYSPTYDYLEEGNGILILKDQIIKLTSNYPECRIILTGRETQKKM